MLCYTCNKEKDNLLNIYNKLPNNGNPRIIDMLEFCTKVKLDSTKEYPKHICYDCLKQLNITYKFLKRFDLKKGISHNYREEFLTIPAKLANSSKASDSEQIHTYIESCTEAESISEKRLRDDNTDAGVVKKYKMNNSQPCTTPVQNPTPMEIYAGQKDLRVACRKCSKSFYTVLGLNLHMKIYHR